MGMKSLFRRSGDCSAFSHSSKSTPRATHNAATAAAAAAAAATLLLLLLSVCISFSPRHRPSLPISRLSSGLLAPFTSHDSSEEPFSHAPSHVPSRMLLSKQSSASAAAPSCPKWFKFIKEDFTPWRERGGIKLIDLHSSTFSTQMRIKILGGKLFVQIFENCFFTRTQFTLWGLLQLLRRFPGQVPDVDFFFGCQDVPAVNIKTLNFAEYLPIQLRFSKLTSGFHDLLWPDYSFWGWPEVMLDEWEALSAGIVSSRGGSKAWVKRQPLAHWKGATHTRNVRRAVVECSDGEQHKWGVAAYSVDWNNDRGKEETAVESQCDYRYKIYIEGIGWSASLKYIMACGSTPIFIQPEYMEYFSRGLVEGVHYLKGPGQEEQDICRSLNKTISEANASPRKAMEIAANARRFILEDINMDRVYDYMFHFLKEYASLQLFTPKLPSAGYVEVTPEWIVEYTAPELRYAYKELDVSEHNSPPCVLQ